MTATLEASTSAGLDGPHAKLRRAVEHASHLLPSQGPITVFVHHNTLHALEDLPFDRGVEAGGRMYRCHAYLPEPWYREALGRGRIRVTDLEAVLLEDLADESDRLVASFGTRYALQLAMLRFPLQSGPSAELRWFVAESDALRRFRGEVEPAVRNQMISATRRWVIKEFADGSGDTPRAEPACNVLGDVLDSLDTRSIDTWNEATWEAFVLNFLWRVCHCGVGLVEDRHVTSDSVVTPRRHRDLLIEATGEDSDLAVHEILIRFCAAFVDQGFAGWGIPARDEGFFAAFLNLYSRQFIAPTRWYKNLKNESRRLSQSGMSPLESIEESLQLLGVTAEEQESFIAESLLALRGWAGMIWQLETNAEWVVHPAPPGTLIEFLAVRLVLDRLSIGNIARASLGFDGSLTGVRDLAAAQLDTVAGNGREKRAFQVFQLAQVRGWKPEDLQQLSQEQWKTLIHEIESFSSLERRRIFHLAFERKYRNETLDAVVAHAAHSPRGIEPSPPMQTPAYQVVCCIDEREESFRRHLEEFDPECETLGVAGFFGVAMYYRGVADAHYKPLCPVNIKPRHYVVEEPLYSVAHSERRKAETRRRIGAVTHRTHLGTRTFLGGLFTGLFGSLAAFPLIARVLFPRTTARLRRSFGGMVHTPSTELRLERIEQESNRERSAIGYSVDEMAAIVEGGLRALGLSRSELYSPLVVICGHGSSSLNNPHEAAHDCGACGGGRGGPNARAFAQMANDPRVRHKLAAAGLSIPEQSYFVGGYHNTCDDSMTWYDLDRIPILHRGLFERSKAGIDEARKRSAHERCRRFESAELSLSIDDALRHVEGRAEDLSQTRPEYGHASNAVCFVGRRAWSRNMFLDRRAFLTSYDPTQDDQNSSILERMLQAVIPVCAGINLEYYFSYVDPTGYGCGTKLPHNITSLVGVMDGAASDLRPGLPWQMVEIHEPVRILFLIETTPRAMQRIINDNEAIARLVGGQWVQLALFDAAKNQVYRYINGRFVNYQPESLELPHAQSSIHWYRGHRDHLGYASIKPTENLQPGREQLA